MSKKPIMVPGMYYSNQRMLFIGEGDFSFSSSIATQFGFATNIVATSRDSKDLLQKYYGNDALNNIDNLHRRGAQVHHGVDVDKMFTTSERVLPLGQSIFDVIIFNFPHAGFFGREDDPNVIWMHQKLMTSFFKIAALMLSHGGLVYVSHKCGYPYDNWNLPHLAQMNGLEFLKNIPFRSTHFPDYKHRRGSGKRAGELFGLGRATTYIFRIRDSVWIGGIKEQPLQTEERNAFFLETSNLQTFKKKEIECGRAPWETPLPQIITTKVARLEALKLAQKKQKKPKRLKLKSKVVETPSAVQDRRITGLQATSSCENLQKVQKSAQKVLKKAIEENRREKTLLSEKCREQVMCDSAKNECPPKQQREVQVLEEVLEIHASDDYIFADEPSLESEEGDENHKDPVLCALVLKNQTPLSDLQYATEPENNSGRKIEGRNYIDRIDQEAYMYSQEEDQSDRPDLEFSQNSDEDHGDLPEVFESFQESDGDQSDNMPDLDSFQDSETELSEMLRGDEVLDVCKVMKVWESEDMAGEHFPLQFSPSFAATISIWINTYICSCFGKIN